jgi:WD40 repeat protein
MKFSYTGQDLIVERGGDVLYFNTTTWQSEHKFSNPIPIYYMDVSPDQSIIATSDKQTNIKLWDYNSGNLIKEIPGSANAWPLQFNKSGTKLFAIINSDLFGWDISSANVVRHITNIGRSYYMAINDEYDLAVVSYLEFGIAAWEISSGYHTQQIVEGVNWLFSTPGNYIIGQGFNQYYYIWELVKKWTSPIQ